MPDGTVNVHVGARSRDGDAGPASAVGAAGSARLRTYALVVSGPGVPAAETARTDSV